MITKIALRSLIVEELDNMEPYMNERFGKGESELLNEGFKETAMSALQYVVAAGAEYGIALGTAGAGLAGPAETVEMLVNLAFTTESIMSTITSLTDVSNVMEEGRRIISEAESVFNLIPQSLDQFYNSVKDIVARVMSTLGAGVTELANRLQSIISDKIDKAIAGIQGMIKTIIPDATIGLAVATAIGYALSNLSANVYNLIKTAFQKAGKFAEWILNPQSVMSFFDASYPQIISICQQAAQRVGSSSMISSLLTGGGAGAALKLFGPTGFNKLAEWLTQAQPGVRAVVESIATKAVPFVLLYTAMSQIIISGDYPQPDTTLQKAAGLVGQAKSATGSGNKVAAASAKVKNKLSESRKSTLSLRRVDERIRILESMELEEHIARVNETRLRALIHDELGLRKRRS